MGGTVWNNFLGSGVGRLFGGLLGASFGFVVLINDVERRKLAGLSVGDADVSYVDQEGFILYGNEPVEVQ